MGKHLLGPQILICTCKLILEKNHMSVMNFGKPLDNPHLDIPIWIHWRASYECKVCRKTFTQSSALVKHLWAKELELYKSTTKFKNVRNHSLVIPSRIDTSKKVRICIGENLWSNIVIFIGKILIYGIWEMLIPSTDLTVCENSLWWKALWIKNLGIS